MKRITIILALLFTLSIAIAKSIGSSKISIEQVMKLEGLALISFQLIIVTASVTIGIIALIEVVRRFKSNKDKGDISKMSNNKDARYHIKKTHHLETIAAWNKYKKRWIIIAGGVTIISFIVFYSKIKDVNSTTDFLATLKTSFTLPLILNLGVYYLYLRYKKAVSFMKKDNNA